MYSAIDLAKYIVTKCMYDNSPISNIQLQNILYYIQEEYLQKYGKPLFPENIEAWPFGAAIPDVYYYFCGFGAMPISSTYDVDIEKKDQLIINPIIEEKRILKLWDLLEQILANGSAWEQTYRGGRGNHSTIPILFIQQGGG